MKVRGTKYEIELPKFWKTFFSGGFICYVGFSLVHLADQSKKTGNFEAFILASSAFIGGGLMVYGLVVILGDIKESNNFKDLKNKISNNFKRLKND